MIREGDRPRAAISLELHDSTAQALAALTRVEVQATLNGAPVSSSISAVLFRVAEEAVVNAVRHGSPRTVGVHLRVDERYVRLAVVDDGRGFDARGGPAGHPGIGLFTMRQRVALAGGIFDVDSRPGAGTVVSAIVPLRTGNNLDAGS